MRDFQFKKDNFTKIIEYHDTCSTDDEFMQTLKKHRLYREYKEHEEYFKAIFFNNFQDNLSPRLEDYLDDDTPSQIELDTLAIMEKLPKLHRLVDPQFNGKLKNCTWYEKGKPIIAYYDVNNVEEKYMYENVEMLDELIIYRLEGK